MALDHVMMMDHLQHWCGPTLLGEDCLLWNSERISKGDAIRVMESGGFSPYVLVIPQVVYDGLFRNKDVGSAICCLQIGRAHV